MRQNAFAPAMVRRHPATFNRIFVGRMSRSEPVVGERHPQVGREPQHLVAVGVEPVEQVDVLGPAPPAALPGVVVGVGRPAAVEDRLVAAPVGGQQVRGQPVRAVVASGAHGAVDLAEQPVHPVGPAGLAVDLGDRGQLAEQVRVMPISA